MKRTLLLLIICSTIFISCLNSSQKQNTHVANERKQVANDSLQKKSNSIEQLNLFEKCTNYENRLSIIASKVEFVKLDNTPPLNSFFINDVRITQKYLFLSGQTHIYQYSRDGKFIRQIGSHGRGPKEYLQLSPPLQLDRAKELIYALDEKLDKIIIYNFDGVYQGKISIGNENNCFEIIDSTTIAFRQVDYHRCKPNCEQISFVDFNGVVTKTYRSRLYPLPKERFQNYGANVSFLWSHQDNIFSLEYGADTIYQIINNSLIPSRVIEGDLRLDDDEYFRKEVGKNKLEVFPYMFRPNSGIFESDKFILFRFLSEEERFFSIYDKETGEFYRTFHKDASSTRKGSLKMEYFIDDWATGLPFNPQYQSGENAIGFISAMDIYQKKSEVIDFINNNGSTAPKNIEEIIANIKEDDNDIIMIVQFK
jgi:hypothetical protein